MTTWVGENGPELIALPADGHAAATRANRTLELADAWNAAIAAEQVTRDAMDAAQKSFEQAADAWERSRREMSRAAWEFEEHLRSGDA